MANGKRTSLGDTARLYGKFITRLHALGCVRCPSCGDYVFPEHLTHACAGSLRPALDDCHSLPKAA